MDLERLRRETPGCKQVLHFNNAGASLIPKPVLDAVMQYQLLEAQIGAYEAAAQESGKIQNFYQAAAKLLNAQPGEIAYLENATRAWDMAFYSLEFKPGDRILTAQAEYASNYIAFLQVARRTGAVIEVIPNDEHGQLSLSALERMIDRRVKLIAITHVPTHGGLINPAEEVGKIAAVAKIFYLLDATQSIGQMPLDVKKLRCDALCATGRKYLRAPRGTGFLFVRQEALEKMEPPFLDLHAAQWSGPNEYTIMPDGRRFETWETSYANKIGLATAIDYTQAIGLEAIWERIQLLAHELRVRLSAIPGLTLQDLGLHQCGLVSFTMKGWDPTDLCLSLRKQHINVSVSLPEYAKLDFEARGLSKLVRASVHYYNTLEEIERFCDALMKR